jgi:DNA-binding transcriptional LysR family regulator
MDRHQSMRIFVAVAEEEGFAAAARKLGLSPPAVTRAVAELEQHLGTLLLHRTTRIVRPSEAGMRYLADCKRILAEIDEAEAAIAGAHLTPRGALVVTAPVMFGRLHVAPLLLDFLDAYPAVSARALLLDRVVDIIEEGIDVAIRIAQPQDSSLMGIGVGSIRRVLCAAPAYLARRGEPRSPADLERHATITFTSATVEQSWTFGSGGKTQRIALESRFSANSTDATVDAAIAGHGIVRALSYQVAQPVREGKLKILLSEFEPPPVPVQIVHAEGRRASARVRAFVDFAAQRLRADPALRPFG